MRLKITLDDKNFNKHTVAGMDLLERSVEKVGVIEAVTVSSDGKIISGNARHEKISKVLKGVDPIVVDTDGSAPIIIRRNDIHSDTKEFYEAAILANTVSKKNINLDEALIQEVAVDEYDIYAEELGVDMVDDCGGKDFAPVGESGEDRYTKKIVSPIYEPTDEKPTIEELFNNEKYLSLVAEIEAYDLPEKEKGFLKIAAARHIVFDYAKIANFYPNASKEMQSLMENSALIIIDFNKAIELGYVKLSDSIRDEYAKEYGDEE